MLLAVKDGRLEVKSGRSKFNLAVLPAADFPDFTDGKFNAEFELDIASLFAPVSFAISTEETRYYLNGVFFRGGKSVAVATDGHRLARNYGPDLPEFEGVIVPRKMVGLLPKGPCSISVSPAKIRIVGDGMTIVSKLIDGTFPDYERVIPRDNDKFIVVDREAVLRAADRVVTISSTKGRAVKLSLAPGSMVLTARSEVGDATDEIAAEYTGEPFDIGFNAQYLRDLLSVLPDGEVKMVFAEGAPGLITGGLETWTGVVMPMRV
jgi:DNA polymerase-3 subunit beta